MTFSLIDEETQKKNRPAINLQFYKIAASEKEYYWRMFRKYHYLSHSFNHAAHTFVCTCNGKIAGFCSALAFAHPRRKNTMRGHRTVVFPDYQGVGIGHALSNFIADYYAKQGKSFISTTSNPAMIMARKKDPNWRMTRCSRASSGSGLIQNKHIKGSTSSARITAGFEWRGTQMARCGRISTS
jgi:GNAT superfamily N-acetyltransferase